MKEVIIDGIKYQEVQKESSIKICILQRGWVFVGWFEKDDNNNCTLSNSYCVRKWGTNSGLGQLAKEGPLSETILDKAGTVKFDYLTVVATIDCEESKWNKKI